MTDQRTGWPSAAVAIAILALVGAVTIAAIGRYSLAEVLQIWQAMAAIIGLVSGAFVTYFFTRSAVETAEVQARNALLMASHQERRADATQQALTKAVGLVDAARLEQLMQDPVFRLATSLPDNAPHLP
jgi:hypothetical protein